MPHLSRWMIRIAFVYLMVGFTLGTLLLMTKVGWLSGHFWLWRPVHMECLISGWLYHLVLGVAYWMFPRLTGGLKPRKKAAKCSPILFNIGLLLFLIGTLQERTILLLCGRFFEWLALLLFVYHLLPRVKAFATEHASHQKSQKQQVVHHK